MDPKDKGKGKEILPPQPPREPETNATDIRSSLGGVYWPQEQPRQLLFSPFRVKQHHQPPLVPVTNATDIRPSFGVYGPPRRPLQQPQQPSFGGGYGPQEPPRQLLFSPFRVKQHHQPPLVRATNIMGPQQQHHEPLQQPTPPPLVGPQQKQQEVKKKRGRPRKYGPDGELIEPKRSEEPLVIPHLIEVKIGEDIKSKVMEFTGEEPRTVCIISGNGAVSSATLCSEPNPSLCLKGVRYNINHLRGFFTSKVVNDSTQISGQLNVALDGPDGKVVVGNVVGPLIAATQVQVVVGSFVTSANSGDNDDEGVNPQAASAPANTSNSQRPSTEFTDDNDTQQPM